MTDVTTRRPRGRAGYTLAELLIAMTLTVAIIGLVVPFFNIQTRSLTANSGRADALQSARYAQNFIDRDLRNAGIGVMPANSGYGVPRNQPKIIQADTFAVTFNTDLVTRDSLDLQAVHYDPTADSLLDSAMPVARQVTLPRSTALYPDYQYVRSNGTPSGAEMLSYWVSRDSTSSRTDEYVLWRRVNDGPKTVVSTGVRIPSGQPLFQYKRINGAGQIVDVLNNELPILWNTAASRADSLRVISLRVRTIYKGYNLRNDTMTVEREIHAQTRIMNAGLAEKGTCGDIPLTPSTIAAALQTDASGNKYIHVTWSGSTDETSGERDVERYPVYRRPSAAAAFTDPITSVGRGGRSYDDFSVTPGTWVYAVSAQDCSPANSPMVVSTAVTVP
jgi:hypothetical protein